MEFWLGTHKTGWLARLDVPLFVSHTRLSERVTLPVARERWALDSGGFTMLDQPPHRWTITADEYVEAVQRYATDIGKLAWAAPMDWMCEPWIVGKTGLSVREHQERTVANFLDLRDRGPFIPVLQGWTFADYEACIDLYSQAGVDLAEQPLVGLGSVCRRQAADEIAAIVRGLHDDGLRLHGFGVKKGGLERLYDVLDSADSMAWSFRARRSDPLPGCSHKACNNCPKFALKWRAEVLAMGDRLALF